MPTGSFFRLSRLKPSLSFDVNDARSVSLTDPFERLIVGTAVRPDMPLIMRDQQIVESGLVQTIW